MKSFLKHLFCSHVYKLDKKEKLRQIRYFYVITDKLKYIEKQYALHEHCIKCGKELIRKIIEID